MKLLALPGKEPLALVRATLIKHGAAAAERSSSVSQPPRSRQKRQPGHNAPARQGRDAAAKKIEPLAGKDEAAERHEDAEERTLMRRRPAEVLAGRDGRRPREYIAAIGPWLAEHRRTLLVGVGGMLAGVIVTCLFLALLAPQPEAVTPTGSSGGADATATLDDTYLGDLIAESLAQAALPFGVQHVAAHAKAGNEIDVSGDLTGVPTLPGQPARRMTARLQLSAVNGALHAHIESIDFGGLGLPGLATATLESQINAHLRFPALMQAGGHRYAVTSVTTKDGSVTMTLKRS